MDCARQRICIGARHPPCSLRRGRAVVSFPPPRKMRGVERRAAHRSQCVPNIRVANANIQNAWRVHHTPRLPALHLRSFFASGRASEAARSCNIKPAPGGVFCTRAEPRTAGVQVCVTRLPEPHQTGDFSPATEATRVYLHPRPSLDLRHSRTPHESVPSRAGQTNDAAHLWQYDDMPIERI
jgi:hypothetical protein